MMDYRFYGLIASHDILNVAINKDQVVPLLALILMYAPRLVLASVCRVLNHCYNTVVPPPRYISSHKSSHRNYTMASAADYKASEKYPAKVHAAKVAAQLVSRDPLYRSATIYIEAQKTRLLEDNDEPEPFR